MNHYIIVGLYEHDRRAFVKKSSLTVPFIVNTVANFTGVEVSKIKGLVRKRSFVEARQISMYFIKKNTCLTLEAIGELFNRDHSTVITSIRTVEDLMIEHKFNNKIAAINKLIND